MIPAYRPRQSLAYPDPIYPPKGLVQLGPPPSPRRSAREQSPEAPGGPLSPFAGPPALAPPAGAMTLPSGLRDRRRRSMAQGVRPAPVEAAVTPPRPLSPSGLSLRITGTQNEKLGQDLQKWFESAQGSLRKYGLEKTETTEVRIEFIDRREWRNVMVDRDALKRLKDPEPGVLGYWRGFKNWLSRLIHTYTTAVYNDRGPTRTIYVVRENIARKDDLEQFQRLAESMVNVLQRVAFRPFFESLQKSYEELHRRSTDRKQVDASEAWAHLHAVLCLHDMPIPVVAEPATIWHKLNPFARAGSIKDPKVSELVARLEDPRHRPHLRAWCRKLFEVPMYARFLFEQGGEVRLSEKLLQQDRPLIDSLRKLNRKRPPAIAIYT